MLPLSGKEMGQKTAESAFRKSEEGVGIKVQAQHRSLSSWLGSTTGQELLLTLATGHDLQQ